MRNMKLFSIGYRYCYKHYNQKVNTVERSNLLNKVFESSGRNKILVGDITYVSTRKGMMLFIVKVEKEILMTIR